MTIRSVFLISSLLAAVACSSWLGPGLDAAGGVGGTGGAAGTSGGGASDTTGDGGASGTNGSFDAGPGACARPTVFVGAHTVADDGSPPRMSFDVPVTVVSVDDWSADAEKAKGARMEKKGKALQEAGDKSGNKDEEAEGKTMKKKGHAIEKEGEARGDAAEQMEKSGNKAEKAGVESREKSAKAKTDSKK